MPKKYSAKEQARRDLLGISDSESDGEGAGPPPPPPPPPEDPNLVQCEGACGKKHHKDFIVRCEAGHAYCFDDARVYTTAQLGKGVPVLKCINATCDKIFPGSEVLRFIDLDIFKGFPKASLEVMVVRVGVKELVEICPNCNTVNNCGPLSPANQTYVCRNTDCKRESCRKCKRLAHGSVECDDALKTSFECGHCIPNYPPAKIHPASNIVRCEVGHPFCIESATAYLTSQLGKGIPVINCLHPGCDKIFPGTEVLRFINLDVFKGLPKATLDVMVVRVGVKDLVEICPNCNTVTNCGPLSPTNQTYVCRNTDCKRESCRKCKRVAHGQVECDDALKDSFECGHCIPNYPPAKIHPASNIVRCEVGHPFCIEAATAYLTSQLGKGIPVINCLHPGCDKIFPGTEVLRFIDLDVFKGLPKATLEKMIERVGVKGLVEICPNCLFVTNTGALSVTTILNCRNPDCKRSYCRKCRRTAHGTTDCDENAKTSFECTHCYKIYPNEDAIVRCEKGHPYCFDAAKDSLTSQLGKGISALHCLEPGCDKIIPGKDVLRFIDLNLFKGWPRDKLLDLIERGGVKGLVELCPNCDTIILCGPVEETNELHCPNADCKKKFCRKCNKDAHGPLTCEDNDKKLAGGDVTGTTPGGTAGTSDGKTPGTGAGGDGKTPGAGGTAGDGKTPGSGGAGGAGGAGGGGAGAGGDDNDPTCDCKKKTAASLQDYITQAIFNARGKKFAEDLLNAALFRPCKNCQELILKKGGDNFLSCPRCKQTQCYLCGDGVKDDSHYKDSAKTCNGKQFVAPSA
ncbi:hypothetical protein DFH27DRAFT_552511 [Peziza echinospora]|nr:hypothetical protein DFH27DRAFT_552511 [Peziza echinospora]